MMPSNIRQRVLKRIVLVTIVVLSIAASISTAPHAQSFISGSDGSDGPLTIAANQGTILFDPLDKARWGQVLDSDGDGVYNFTTVTVGLGSTLKLQGDKVNRPVHWLASGDVAINGTLDLSGAAGTLSTDLSFRRLVSIPGSGGYAGGAGGNLSLLATPGEGPGGGSGGVLGMKGCGVVGYTCGMGGVLSANHYLIPLVGGSGGEGMKVDVSNRFYGGGAGGGAILIASSTSIVLSGTILATGGPGRDENVFANCCAGAGGGSGGAVRLVAPVISGNGVVNVAGGTGIGNNNGPVGPPVDGGAGWVRLEAYQISTSLGFPAGGSFVTRGTPVDPSTLRPASSIRVTAIDGIQLLSNPSGSFVLPDVTINKSTPVTVDISATGIPPGTIVTLQVYPQTPTDLTIVNLPTAQATLNGTVQSSTATATFTFPYGFSRGFVRATWAQ